MDTAARWQDRVVEELAKFKVTFLNPRRNDWDSSIKQSVESAPFCEQVNWELDAIETSDIVVFYFDPNTKSPVTLLELGLAIKYGSEKVIVCCPDGFWRKGNVDIVCARNGIPVLNSLDDLIDTIKPRLTQIILDTLNMRR